MTALEKQLPGTGGNEKHHNILRLTVCCGGLCVRKDPNDFLVTIINKLPNYVRNSGLELIHALETERSVTQSRLQHGHTAVMSDLGC